MWSQIPAQPHSIRAGALNLFGGAYMYRKGDVQQTVLVDVHLSCPLRCASQLFKGLIISHGAWSNQVKP